jgi:hypothetical protein
VSGWAQRNAEAQEAAEQDAIAESERVSLMEQRLTTLSERVQDKSLVLTSYGVAATIDAILNEECGVIGSSDEGYSQCDKPYQHEGGHATGKVGW